MKYKLKPGLSGGQLVVNINGVYYRFKADEYRDYPDNVIDYMGDQIEPEHKPKPKAPKKEDNE